jgi:uncharacterized membrane protein
MALHLGKRIAPPRFLLYAVALIAIGVWSFVWEGATLQHFLVGFDIATFAFLASLIPMVRAHNPEDIARHASENDANRVALLIVSLSISAVVLGALTLMVTGKSEYSKIVEIVTLALAWMFANTVYALHYAHLYYSAGEGNGGYAGGLVIPSTDAPDYADFLHFALILGMTFQTADIDITSRSIRLVSTGHCLAAFVFNIGILAFSINMIAGG